MTKFQEIGQALNEVKRKKSVPKFKSTKIDNLLLSKSVSILSFWYFLAAVLTSNRCHQWWNAKVILWKTADHKKKEILKVGHIKTVKSFSFLLAIERYWMTLKFWEGLLFKNNKSYWNNHCFKVQLFSAKSFTLMIIESGMERIAKSLLTENFKEHECDPNDIL